MELIFGCLQPSATVKAGLILRLKMLSMIFNTLDMQAANESTIITSSPTEQPVYLILERVLPVLVGIVDKWRNNAAVIQVNHFILNDRGIKLKVFIEWVMKLDIFLYIYYLNG